MKRWEIHPYSALVVIDRISKAHIGHVVLGHGDWEGDREKGWSEVAIVLKPDYWNVSYVDKEKGIGAAGNTGIGTEVMRAAIAYAKALKTRGELAPSDITEAQCEEVEAIAKKERTFRVHRNEEGKIDWVYLPLKEIHATASFANEAGFRILQKVFLEENKGMQLLPDKDGSDRHRFKILNL